jgi:hypothetical protein
MTAALIAATVFLQAEYIPREPQVRPRLIVYVDEHVEREKRFKEELTQRWSDRLPDETWARYSKAEHVETRAFCGVQDARVRFLRRYFDISFEDRGSREFSILVNRGFLIELPNDDRLLKTTMPLRVMEYVYRSYYQREIREAWHKRVQVEFALAGPGGVPWEVVAEWIPKPRIPKSPLAGLEIDQDLILEE